MPRAVVGIRWRAWEKPMTFVPVNPTTVSPFHWRSFRGLMSASVLERSAHPLAPLAKCPPQLLLLPGARSARPRHGHGLLPFSARRDAWSVSFRVRINAVVVKYRNTTTSATSTACMSPVRRPVAWKMTPMSAPWPAFADNRHTHSACLRTSFYSQSPTSDSRNTGIDTTRRRPPHLLNGRQPI